MKRSTADELKQICRVINTTLDQAQEEYRVDDDGAWIRDADGRPTPNAGTFTLDFANGGVALNRVCATGGQDVVIARCTSRECRARMLAFLAGIETGMAALPTEDGGAA
ncbi:MAG: hypothetical protein MK101_12070 [Phycisphaerales bacterium]|nr:hypothetical protein [Phycisphaerales bacterium]